MTLYIFMLLLTDSSPCSVEPKDRVLCGEGFELHVENLCKRKGCCFRYDLNFGEKCFHPREPGLSEPPLLLLILNIGIPVVAEENKENWD